MKIPGGIALVTGGGSGIGRATVVALAGRGASVVVVDRDEAGARHTIGLTGGPTNVVFQGEPGRSPFLLASLSILHRYRSGTRSDTILG